MLLVQKQEHYFDENWKNSFAPGKISVIIPVYQAKLDTLPHVLSLIEHHKQTDNLETELIIVNNGIPEEVFQSTIENTHLKNSIIFKSEKNLGASWGRNKGAELSKGEFLLFIDSDVLKLTDNCIHFMKQILQENKDVGVIGGQLVEFDKTHVTIFLGRYFDEKFLEHKEKYTMFEDEYNNTSCIMVRRDDFARINGFTDYIEYMHDDVDFGFKMNYINLKCIVDYRTLCYHPIPPQKMNQHTLFMMYKNALVFYMVNYTFTQFLNFSFHKLKVIFLKKNKKPKDETVSSKQQTVQKEENEYKSYLVFLDAFRFIVPRIFQLFFLRIERQKFLRTLK